MSSVILAIGGEGGAAIRNEWNWIEAEMDMGDSVPYRVSVYFGYPMRNENGYALLGELYFEDENGYNWVPDGGYVDCGFGIHEGEYHGAGDSYGNVGIAENACDYDGFDMRYLFNCNDLDSDGICTPEDSCQYDENNDLDSDNVCVEDADLYSVSQRVQENRALVNRNADDILENAEGVVNNADAIADNGEDIATNADAITDNSDALASLEDGLTDQQSSIGDLETAVGLIDDQLTDNGLAITNAVEGDSSAAFGGLNNQISGDQSVIGGGEGNQLISDFGTIAGGQRNIVVSNYGSYVCRMPFVFVVFVLCGKIVLTFRCFMSPLQGSWWILEPRVGKVLCCAWWIQFHCLWASFLHDWFFRHCETRLRRSH